MSTFDARIFNFKLYNTIPWIVGGGLFLMFIVLKMGTTIPDQSIFEEVLKNETAKTSEMLVARDKAALAYHLQAGKELFNAGRYPDARINLSRALEIDPDNKTAFDYISRIQAHEDEVRLAREKQNQDEAAKEREISRLLLRVDELHRKGADKAAQMLIQTLPYYDDRIERRSRIIEAAISRKDKEQREKLKKMGALKASIKRWYVTAKKRYETGQYADSLYYLNKIIATKNNALEIRKAKRLIPIIRKIISDKVQIKLAEANQAYAQKKYNEALTLYQYIRKTSPTNKIARERGRFLTKLLLQMVKGHYEKGEVYDGLSMFEKAQREYKMAIRLTPDKTNEYYKKARRKIRRKVASKQD